MCDAMRAVDGAAWLTPLEHVPIARTRPAKLAGLRERRNMLYKYMI